MNQQKIIFRLHPHISHNITDHSNINMCAYIKYPRPAELIFDFEPYGTAITSFIVCCLFPCLLRERFLTSTFSVNQILLQETLPVDIYQNQELMLYI